VSASAAKGEGCRNEFFRGKMVAAKIAATHAQYIETWLLLLLLLLLQGITPGVMEKNMKFQFFIFKLFQDFKHFISWRRG
jgi:hypothetical protein